MAKLLDGGATPPSSTIYFMNKLFEIALIVVGGSAVAVADVLIKKIASDGGTFRDSFKTPLMFGVLGLYVAQILIFLFLFHKKVGLGVLGLSTFALYTIIVTASAVFLFQEKISLTQGIGMLLAALGVLFMNI